MNADFYVSTNGDDKNPGNRGKPFAGLARARNAVRELKERFHQVSVSDRSRIYNTNLISVLEIEVLPNAAATEHVLANLFGQQRIFVLKPCQNGIHEFLIEPLNQVSGG